MDSVAYNMCLGRDLDVDEFLDLTPEMEKENCDVMPTCLPKVARISPLSDSRFGNTITTDEELAQCGRGFVPKATKDNTRWAVKNFNEWKEWRCPTSVIPDDLLEGKDAVALNKWLSLYVKETRRKDQKQFPSKSIDLLLAGLKRHMKELNPETAIDIFDEKDTRFNGLRGMRDTRARQLREDGVGANVKHTSVFSETEEEKLWSTDVLGTDSPKPLLNAVFFTVGKVFCLRGGREHELLKLSQFQFGIEDSKEFVVYTENGAKNRSGSYKDHSEAKQVKHFANERLGERCVVYLLKLLSYPLMLVEKDSTIKLNPVT